MSKSKSHALHSIRPNRTHSVILELNIIVGVPETIRLDHVVGVRPAIVQRCRIFRMLKAPQIKYYKHKGRRFVEKIFMTKAARKLTALIQ